MTARLEVFADITCPFTHLGLKRVAQEVAENDLQVDIIVRAWPLEWVNGAPLDAEAVEAKIDALKDQLDTPDFSNFCAESWPTSTLPALNLAAGAFDVDPSTGLTVSLAIRNALFEEGQDVGDPTVLADLAARFGLKVPVGEVHARVHADYQDGQKRKVRGSPDFWLGDEEFFCPALVLGHDTGGLTAKFDTEGFEDFLQRVRASAGR